MATWIKNIITVVVPAGASVVALHQLNWNGLPVLPDIIFVPKEVTVNPILVTDTQLQVFNPTAGDLTVSILLESWHTIERAFGDKDRFNLTPQPYIVYVGDQGDVPTPPFSPFLTDAIIYARTTGSDVTGTGTLANPYRTWQRAIRDVPNFIPPGVRYIVDGTGVDETFPDDFVLPSWKSAQLINGYDFGDPNFYVLSAVQLRAYPETATTYADGVTPLPAGQRVIDPAAVWTPDPVTGLVAIQDVTKAWVPGALKGRFLVGTGDVFQKCVIYDNTADTLFITDGFQYTDPVTIMESSAVWTCQASDPFGFSRAGIYAGHQDSLVFAGIGIVPVAATDSPGLSVTGGTVFSELCNLVDPLIRGADWLFQFTATNVQKVGSEGGNVENGIACIGSRFADGINFRGGQGKIEGFSNAFDACGPVGRSAPSELSLFGSVIINAIEEGVRHSGTGLLGFVDVTDSVGDAVFAEGPTLLHLESVVGTGNGGVGVHVNNGAQVSVDADGVAGPTTVTGAGGDQQVGDLAAAAYPAAPFSIYDITAVGAGGATGTGARLFTP